MRLFRLTALLVLALALAAPSAHAASSTATNQVYSAYQSSGKINPCKFSDATLKSALKGVTPDLKQYAPDFPDAISQAIEDRASGACDRKATTTSAAKPPAAAPTTTSDNSGQTSTPAAATPAKTTSTPAAQTPAPAPSSAPTTTPAPTPVVDPAPSVADDAIPAAAKSPAAVGSDGAPAPLLVLAILAGVVLLLGALWTAARLLGFDPPWLARWRHASEEAGLRASAAWSEFTDWVRLGR